MDSMRNSEKQAAQIWRDLDLNCSISTVNRWLVKAGLRSHPAAKKPLVFPEDRELRLQFARDYANFPHWNRTFFIDESVFCTDNVNVIRIRR